MALNVEQFGRNSALERRTRPRIEWSLRQQPSTDRALAFGFCAIVAFVFGGFGYLNGLFAGRGLVTSITVAFVTFALSYRHMEGS